MFATPRTGMLWQAGKIVMRENNLLGRLDLRLLSEKTTAVKPLYKKNHQMSSEMFSPRK